METYEPANGMEEREGTVKPIGIDHVAEEPEAASGGGNQIQADPNRIFFGYLTAEAPG